jgi:glutathione S-transferase
MAAPVVHGPSYSTYVRTARLALIEKGVEYKLQDVNMFAGETKAAPHIDRQPFGKVPSFEHDGFDLYETGAIVRYVDRAFPGKPLQPTDPRHAARMDQIISIVDSYAYGAIVGQLVWQRLVVPMTGGQPDEAVVAGSLPRVTLCLSEFERLAAGGSTLVGGGLSLADLYLGPVFAYLMGTPEAGGLLADKPKLKAWWSATAQTAGMKGTEPQFG